MNNQLSVARIAELQERAMREIENKAATMRQPNELTLLDFLNPLPLALPQGGAIVPFTEDQMRDTQLAVGERSLNEIPHPRAEAADPHWRATHPAPVAREIRDIARSGDVPAWEDSHGRVYVRGPPEMAQDHEEVFFVATHANKHPVPGETVELRDAGGRTWMGRIARTFSVRPYADASLTVWMRPLERGEDVREAPRPLSPEPLRITPPAKRKSLAEWLEEAEDIPEREKAPEAPPEVEPTVVSEPPVVPEPPPADQKDEAADAFPPGSTGAAVPKPARKPATRRRKKQ